MGSTGAAVLYQHTQQDTSINSRHEVDRLGAAGSASNESRSLDHLLLMHTLVGAQWRTSAAAQVEDLARADRRLHGRTQAGRGRAAVMSEVAAAGGTARRSCIRVWRCFNPYPLVSPKHLEALPVKQGRQHLQRVVKTRCESDLIIPRPSEISSYLS